MRLVAMMTMLAAAAGAQSALGAGVHTGDVVIHGPADAAALAGVGKIEGDLTFYGRAELPALEELTGRLWITTDSPGAGLPRLAKAGRVLVQGRGIELPALSRADAVTVETFDWGPRADHVVALPRLVATDWLTVYGRDGDWRVDAPALERARSVEVHDHGRLAAPRLAATEWLQVQGAAPEDVTVADGLTVMRLALVATTGDAGPLLARLRSAPACGTVTAASCWVHVEAVPDQSLTLPFSHLDDVFVLGAPSLRSLALPALQLAYRIGVVRNPVLASVEAPVLHAGVRELSFRSLPALGSVAFPQLQTDEAEWELVETGGLQAIELPLQARPAVRRLELGAGVAAALQAQLRRAFGLAH